MKSYFSSEFFSRNREKLRNLTGSVSPIVVTAAGILQRNGDSGFPFRQDSNFWYLTGVEVPDCVLVIDNDQEYIILPKRSHVQEVFDGAHDQDQITQRSGVGKVLNHEQGWKKLGARLKEADGLATLAAPGAYSESHGLFTNPARASLIKTCLTYNDKLEITDIRPHLTAARSVKTPEEIQAIQRAIDITAFALSAAGQTIKTAKYEYEIEAELTKVIRQSNAIHAYQPIVASGKNACTLHYTSNSSAHDKNDLLLIDVGAEVENYAADITRCFSAGKPSDRQQAVAEAVIGAQDFAFSQIKPGITMREYEKQVEQFMGSKLQELGLIKEPTHDDIRHYYPHATSHFLGLDVHDVGDYDKPLGPGMVLTVEPGVYIPEEGIGVRIEDDVLITETGVEVLSKTIPRRPW